LILNKLLEEHPDEARKIKINALLRRERHKKDKQKIKKKKGKKNDRVKSSSKNRSSKNLPKQSSNPSSNKNIEELLELNQVDALNKEEKSPLLELPSDPNLHDCRKKKSGSKKPKSKSSMLNKDIMKDEIAEIASENSVSQSEVNLQTYKMKRNEEGKESLSSSLTIKNENPKPDSKEKQTSNHINLKYDPDEIVNESDTDYKESTDEEILDDEYSNEGEEDDETLDELLFLEAVASLNENISMLTINSTDIFNCFQNLVKETTTLSSTLKEFNTNLLSNQIHEVSEK